MSLEAFVQNILLPEIIVKCEMKTSNQRWKTEFVSGDEGGEGGKNKDEYFHISDRQPKSS